ncbi:uncharacterized protein (DUF305 family) [Saccharopolyspora lacisalsi]|uniref:Uncharacterized protein (DUF305 family) n=1 Tax=Halosaccharopolyspora lacisalsi TaxID=1000566 RepID=A0A839E4P6_9PSEU|nr:DUF305 domain-containing protein [Halosaccharopolyspora lacisalsi]MBA8825888.1 uncharacterized protein (DUF305 family) [Halosaccharopolyspora lacisalsi]
MSRFRASRAVPGVVVALAMVLVGSCTATRDSGRAESGSAPVVLPGAPGDRPRAASSSEIAELGDGKSEPSRAERRYVRMMIPHHRQALTMTDMAPERAKHPRVRGLAGRIGGAQRAEIGMMRGWLKRSGLRSKPDQSVDEQHRRMMGMATEEQLARLEASSGTEFDRLFLRLMTRHHEGAVTMAVDLLEKGTGPQVRSMAKDVMATQRDEIAVMEDLLTEIG